MHRNDDKTPISTPQVMVAAADVDQLEPGPTKSTKEVAATDMWQPGQGAATSISTMSDGYCSSGTARSFLAAASR